MSVSLASVLVLIAGSAAGSSKILLGSVGTVNFGRGLKLGSLRVSPWKRLLEGDENAPLAFETKSSFEVLACWLSLVKKSLGSKSCGRVRFCLSKV